MSAASSDSNASLRWGVYLLLITLAVGNMSGRLFSVNSTNRADYEKHLRGLKLRELENDLASESLSAEELQSRLKTASEQIEREVVLQRPFLSANDRSRWLAVRALVEHGTFAIDGLIDRHVWNTIDMVQHRGRDGQLHLYSSKPPLLIVLVAAEYWVLHSLTGYTLGDEPYLLGRVMLVTINIVPLILMFLLLAKIVERWGRSDWGRVLVVASATCGTFLPTFAVVLNNHIVAAGSAMLALYAWTKIRDGSELSVPYFALAGAAAAFTAANELPALAFLALVTIDLVRIDLKAWTLGLLPAIAIVAAAFFATNYLAHDSLLPPYMHRSPVDPEDNWYDYSYSIDGVERDSYWRDRQGIDRGEPSKLNYAWHVLLGHHGIFSLTPIWLLSAWGLWLWGTGSDRVQREFALAVAALSIVCLVFYIGLRPQEDRNYGGMTSGFRWMFWFAPLWLTAMIPAADWASRTTFRKALACVLLMFSAISCSYPNWNPWVQPWIYDLMEYCGWQGF